MIVRMTAAVAALALCSACDGGDSAAPTGGTSETAPIADAGTPTNKLIPADEIPAKMESVEPAETVTVKLETDLITAVSTIEGAIFDHSPQLGKRLEKDVEAVFDKAELIAAEDADENYFKPHDYQYEYKKSASSGDLISVSYFEMVFTGGAHPNYVLGGITHNRATGEDISGRDLLSDDGAAAMKALLMGELAQQKLERMSLLVEDLPMIQQEVEDVFPKEMDFWFGQVRLLPSTEPDKFGGLMVLYSPYDVGAYAEGSYEIMVTAEKLSAMLSDTYAPMFGGEPIVDETE